MIIFNNSEFTAFRTGNSCSMRSRQRSSATVSLSLQTREENRDERLLSSVDSISTTPSGLSVLGGGDAKNSSF